MILDTEVDRLTEAEIASRAGPLLSVRLVKLPQFYPLDFVGVGETGTICMWVEIKRRNVEFAHYPNYFLSLHKIVAAYNLNKVTYFPAFFVVQFHDVLAYADMLAQPWEVGWDGAAGRAPEPVALIPRYAFNLLTTN